MQNDMRDRLVEIINKDNCPSPYMCSDKCKYSHLEQCIGDRLADRILADGWLRLPCKVGDKVYGFEYPRKDIVVINEETVEDLHLEIETDEGWYGYGEIGETVFLTKEQAEQKLKELSEQDA